MTLDRRSFFTRSCLAAASMAVGPKWLAAGLFDRRSSSAADTVFVVVQMAGGNDPLNTLVPHSDPVYQAVRPRIRLAPSQTLRVDARYGLHPSLTNLHRYLDSGKLAIVQGVGYPNPDLSHFNSMDYWNRASLVPKATGWLGDTLDQLYASERTPLLHSLAIGSELPPAFESGSVTTPALLNAETFAFPYHAADPADDTAQRAAFPVLLAPVGAANADFVANIGSVLLQDSTAIQTAAASYRPSVLYPDGDLASGLKLVATVISANIGPRLFWVTQGGSYDTHDSQRGLQGQDGLLGELDAAVGAFYEDLRGHGQAERVLLMTWSEFGRRVEENGSAGTDHGAASLLFVLGSRVRGGLFGSPLSLTDLDPDGNLKYTTDFRQVYASILSRWIDTDPVPILNGSYPTISFV